MPRPATHHQLRHHHNLLLLCVLALFIILGIIGVKYLWIKHVWREHAVELQGGMQKYQTANSIEDAQMIGLTITSVPPLIPLIKTPSLLQNYVKSLGDQTGRDIVILDKNKKIIADTIQANVGQTYNFDTGQIAETIFDGEPRSFIEKSTDYPNGITQEVVQLKDQKGTVVGAILISPSNFFE